MKFKAANVNRKDVLIRSLKTFVAGFLSVVVAALANILDAFQKGGLSGLKSALLALITGAIAAGITAVWNYYLQATQ